jgi:hypothetical protein
MALAWGLVAGSLIIMAIARPEHATPSGDESVLGCPSIVCGAIVLYVYVWVLMGMAACWPRLTPSIGIRVPGRWGCVEKTPLPFPGLSFMHIPGQ